MYLNRVHHGGEGQQCAAGQADELCSGFKKILLPFSKFKPKEKRRMGSEKLPRCHLKGLLLRAWPILSQQSLELQKMVEG